MERFLKTPSKHFLPLSRRGRADIQTSKRGNRFRASGARYNFPLYNLILNRPGDPGDRGDPGDLGDQGDMDESPPYRLDRPDRRGDRGDRGDPGDLGD